MRNPDKAKPLEAPRFSRGFILFLVGATGFEPAAFALWRITVFSMLSAAHIVFYNFFTSAYT